MTFAVWPANCYTETLQNLPSPVPFPQRMCELNSIYFNNELLMVFSLEWINFELYMGLGQFVQVGTF